MTVQAFVGDLWELHARGAWLVDPTNAGVTRDGRNVMGRGVSRQVAERFTDVPAWYGRRLLAETRPGRPAGERARPADLTGPLVHAHDGHRLLFLVVKPDWRDPASPALIAAGLGQLAAWLVDHPEAEVALPRLGTGAGGLDWVRDVRPLVVRFVLDLPPAARGRLTVVAPPG